MERRLIQLGVVLFGLGLLSGLLTGSLANPRMALSAHLHGLSNATFLIAIGLAWRHINLPPLLERVAVVSLIIGTTANWAVTQLAAVWGTGGLTPIAAPGHQAAGWQEAVVATGLILVTVTMLLAGALLVLGVFRRAGRIAD